MKTEGLTKFHITPHLLREEKDGGKREGTFPHDFSASAAGTGARGSNNIYADAVTKGSVSA